MVCGECTLCCDLFEVKWLNKPVNTKCIHCDLGCKIHDEKPSECTDFDCAYIQSKVTNINLRPYKCGIIFEKLSDNIFYGTVNPNQKPTKYAFAQINNFITQGFSVVLGSIKEPTNKFIISDKHEELVIRNEFAEYLLNRYDK